MWCNQYVACVCRPVLYRLNVNTVSIDACCLRFEMTNRRHKDVHVCQTSSISSTAVIMSCKISYSLLTHVLMCMNDLALPLAFRLSKRWLFRIDNIWPLHKNKEIKNDSIDAKDLVKYTIDHIPMLEAFIFSGEYVSFKESHKRFSYKELLFLLLKCIKLFRLSGALCKSRRSSSLTSMRKDTQPSSKNNDLPSINQTSRYRRRKWIKY